MRRGPTGRPIGSSGGWAPWDSVTPCAKGDHRGDGSGVRRNLTHVISYTYMRYYGGLGPAPGFLAAAGRPGQRQAAQVRAVARRLCLPCPGRGWRPARLRAVQRVVASGGHGGVHIGPRGKLSKWLRVGSCVQAARRLRSAVGAYASHSGYVVGRHLAAHLIPFISPCRTRVRESGYDHTDGPWALRPRRPS